MEKRKLRGGMVGGSIGSLIGPVHRMAATMDGGAEFVAGAFSMEPEKSKKTGEELSLNPARVYSTYLEMLEKEAALPQDQRLDFIAVVTPNALHMDVSKRSLEAGFNVVCEKPMTCTLAEAKELKTAVDKSGKIFALMHTYSGYPMVKQARCMVRQGFLGEIKKVVIQYPQGWLSNLMEGGATVLNMWRMDPKQAGVAGVLADIGTHAEHIGRYITGLEVEEVCADLHSFIPDNRLDDDASVLIHYNGGAKGILYASQVSPGEENDLNVRVYGTKLSLDWHHEAPSYLVVKSPRGYVTTYSQGWNSESLGSEVRNISRLALGHPEGYIEAFANIYREVYKAIRTQLETQPIPICDYPTVDDGLIGMSFVETVIASTKSDKKWTKMLK